VTPIDASDDDSAAQVDVGPTSIDGVPTRAAIAITTYRAKAVLWQVSLAGPPTGAWVLPQRTLADATKLLSICDRRALITTSPKTSSTPSPDGQTSPASTTSPST
jgi:hypothetical protein